MSTLFSKYRKSLIDYTAASASAPVQLVQDTINVALLDITQAKAVTGASNATPIVITCASHGYSTGDRVIITGVGGNTAANGSFVVTNLSSSTFSLQSDTTGSNVAGSGSYTSGGYVINLTSTVNYSDISAKVVNTPQALGTKAISANKLTAAANTFTAVGSGESIGYLVIYKDTGSSATSTLLAIDDTWSGVSKPYVTNGSDLTITWSNGVLAIS